MENSRDVNPPLFCIPFSSPSHRQPPPIHPYIHPTMEMINSEVFTLTYGALVTQLLKDYEDINEVNIKEQLAVRTLVTCQVYLTATFRFDVEPRIGEVVRRGNAGPKSSRKKKLKRGGSNMRLKAGSIVGLNGVPQVEMFALFQRHRMAILMWLQTNPVACNRIMEETVKVVTNNKDEEQLGRLGDRHELAEGMVALRGLFRGRLSWIVLW